MTAEGGRLDGLLDRRCRRLHGRRLSVFVVLFGFFFGTNADISGDGDVGRNLRVV